MRVRARAVRSKGSLLYFDHFIIAVDLVLNGARLSRAGGEPVLFDAILSVISERCNTILGFFFFHYRWNYDTRAERGWVDKKGRSRIRKIR